MIGYIYITTNTINGKIYIGKHQAVEYDKNYYGSGKVVQLAIKKYGIENFTNEILDTADSIEELNEKEKYYIATYREQYGNMMYNIALGGDGGDTISYKTEDEKQEFISKMTKINKDRCSSSEFREKISAATTNRYTNPEERIKQSIKIKAAWSDETLKKEQSLKLKEYYSTHKKDNSYFNKSCCFIHNEINKEFASVGDLKQFLADIYNFHPGNPRLKQLLENGRNGIPFTTKHKNKQKDLIGAIIAYKQNENVETMGDECNPVENEISTFSKCKAEIEEIVQSV